ncbi:MAG: hypothetical protein HOK54_22310 [Alphaproteobacteria bacterium]|nr:hypothetical protein [Alphaproteobacteria bacterium]
MPNIFPVIPAKARIQSAVGREFSILSPEFLLDFATQDRFVYSHKWRVGDLVVWDNPSLVHKSAPYQKYEERRHLHRTVVRGSATF